MTNLINVAKWTITIFLLVYFNSSISKENDKIKFSFAPGEYVSFIQKLTIIKEKDMGSNGMQRDESVSTTKITIRKTQSGWNILAEPKKLSMKRNGKKINNPIVSLLSSAIITYKLDSDGNIIDVDGYGQFIERFSKLVPPKIFEQLTPMLNIEALKRKEFAEWNGRIGDYVGAVVQIGDSFLVDVPYQIPNGLTIHYNVKTHITALVPCGDTECVRIEQSYDSQADNLAKMAGEVVSNVSEAVAPNRHQSSQERNTMIIKGNVTRVINPETMLIFGEESYRMIYMEMNTPNLGIVPVRTTETRKYEFQY